MPGEFGGYSPDVVEMVVKRMSRESVETALERGEKNFDGKDLRDLDLAELVLAGASFRGADVRGLQLRHGTGKGVDEEPRTDISGTDWIDAVFADTGETAFRYVNAENAKFGFSESLNERRVRLAAKGIFGPEEVGAYYGFDGRAGVFRGTTWKEIDFGGSVDDAGNPVEGPLVEALFAYADLTDATFIGVDLTGIDWSDNVAIEGVTIKDPASLRGLTINASQVDVLAAGVRITHEGERDAWEAERQEKGDAKALQEFFGVIVVVKEENE